MINVFISYGHNDYDHVARRIVEDLRARGDLDVFFDVDCLERDDWEQLITQAIERCDYFVFCVSQKSISRDGYCLNELSRACELKKTCIPLMLDESFVPLSITRLQRIFFNRCCSLDKTIIEEVYEPSLQKLIKIVTGQETLGFYNKDIVIEDQLQTFDPYEIVQNSLDFEGRDAFFKDFEEWLNNPSALPLYLLEAAPGVGKTAMASALATRYTASVAGIHFCVHNNAAKTNPKKIILSLACQLAYRSPDYQETLADILKKEGGGEEGAKRLFEIFIIEPCRIIKFDSAQIFVIDGLDEAVANGKNELAEIIVASQGALPSWLRFLVTSRPEEDVRGYFQACHRYAMEESSAENNADIRRFYDKAFQSYHPDEKSMQLLMEKTHGSFLYASVIVKSVKARELDIHNVESFPNGIYSYYKMWFHRIFDDGRIPYEKVRSILSLLSVVQAPPDVSFLADAASMEEKDAYRYVDALSSFLRVQNGLVRPRHKSIMDWLTTPSICPSEYLVLPNDGYKLLYAYIKKVREAGRGWKTNYYVIHEYSRCLRNLKLYDELCSVMQDSKYLLSCLKSPFYNLYEGLEEYMISLACLYAVDEDYCFDVYDSECFASILGSYRMKIYNAGYFLELRTCGFEDYLSEKYGSKIGDNIDYEIGVVHFFYISLNFQKASKRLAALVAKHPLDTLDLDQRSEIERMMLLTYRKEALFGQMEEVAPAAIADARASNNAFEESLDYLTMSKVYCRELKKKESFEAAEEAVRILSEQIEAETDESNTQMGDHLFLAEDYRVYADAAIWHGEYDLAANLLGKAQAIYTLYHTVDRYYPRFLYTSLFLEIARHGETKRIEELRTKLEKVLSSSKDKYDKAQFLFLDALYYFLEGKNNPESLQKVEPRLKQAIAFDKDISVPLEALEAKCLMNLYDEACDRPARFNDKHNEYTDVWIAYVEQKIREWRQNR